MSQKKLKRNVAKHSSLARLERSPEPPVAVEETATENHDEIAAVAYHLWQERGCPFGSDQQDWFRAEIELKNRKPRLASAAGS
jgi:hypothetical protein